MPATREFLEALDEEIAYTQEKLDILRHLKIVLDDHAAEQEIEHHSTNGSMMSDTGELTGIASEIVTYLKENANTPATAAEIASGRGLKRSTVSTRLTQMAREGQLAKAERGYQLVDA